MSDSEDDSHVLGASFRDPSGFLFQMDNILYRQVNQAYRENYDHLIASGLYAHLVKAGLLIPHQEVDAQPVEPRLAYKVIHPECVEFISYPYEWCFSQLRDAALITLKIQRAALEFGMSLKDSSAYNIQFRRGKPVLIDTLSFEKYQEGGPWVAYRQFCQHFLAPLSLMVYRDVRLSQLLRVYIDGIPLDLASELLPWRTRLLFSQLLHIHLHAASQKRYASRPVETTRRVSRFGFLGLVDSLEAAVRRLHWSSSGTEWGDYYNEHNYSHKGLQNKQELVSQFLKEIQPHNVWDLGANTGMFSRLASDLGIPTLAFDVDPGAVEQAYRMCVTRKETNLLPLVMDLTNPSAGIGWHNQERLSLVERGPADTVLALALIHHMAIANNVPLHRLADFFHKIGKRLVIEFVPKQDSQVQRLLATRLDIFKEYTTETFEQVFAQQFVIRRKEAIQDSDRILYWMEGR